MEISLRSKASLCIVLALGSASVARAAVSDADISMLEAEIDALKEDKNAGIKVSGYADASYINDSRDVATLNGPNGDKYGFRLDHLAMFLTKKFDKNWNFFSEVEYEDGTFIDSDPTAPAQSGSVFVESVNIDYQWRPSHYVRFGREFTPAGIWSIDNFAPFVPTTEMPMHIRQIFPAVIDGVDAHGTVPMGATFMDYNVYVANGDGTPGESDNNRQKALGGRVSFILPAFQHLELGASVFRDTNDVDVRKTAYGVHGKLRADKLTLQAEYANDNQKPLGGGAETKQTGYYLQALYDISKWTVGYRYDYWNPDKSAAPSEKVTDNVVMVNYHVSPVIVCKLEHHMVNSQDPAAEDYGRTILSIAYYLGD